MAVDSKQLLPPARKYCPTCMERGVKTPVEQYRKTDMSYCTYHYWLTRGETEGWVRVTLDDYADASRKHFFVTSIPSPDEIRRMKQPK